MTLRPADEAARATALDPRLSVIVQAPAGSGKTELLTRRYLTLLALVDEPEEILAITFTRKAAGEMRERVLKALCEPSPEDPPTSTAATDAARLARARVAKMGWELTANPARLRILTIDGLNAHLVGRMPYLSGHPPRFTVSPDGQELYARAAELALAHLEAEEDLYADALARVLVHLDNRAAKLTAYLVKFLGKRDQWLRRRPSGKSGATLRREMEEALTKLVERRLEAASLALAPHLAEMAALAAYAASNLPEGTGLPRDGAPKPEAARAGEWRAQAWLFLTTEGQPRKPGGVSKRIGFPADGDKSMKERMKAALVGLAADEEAARALAGVREVPDPGYSEGEWSLVAPVLAVYDLAVACLKVAMEESGSTDFTEISLRALAALGSEGEPTDLTLALDHKLKHLLVDEFQDTSRTQYDLLEKLTEGWVPGDGRTLFLVGDPMQSIYRFREADVALFARAREEGLGPVRPARARLTANFRSRAGLVGYFNDLFPRIFPPVDDRSAGGVAYSPADAAVEDEGGERVAFYPLGTDDREEEAHLVADEVSAALAKNPQATVGILLRARTHAPALVEELKRRGIPFRGERLDPLNESLAVLDVVTLARALADRSDRLSWLGVLRAPWCGLTLAECRALVGGFADPVPKLIGDAVAQNLLPGAGGESLARFWCAVEPALAQVGRRPFGQLVEGVWTALGAPAYLDQAGYSDAAQALALLNAHCPGHLPNLAGLGEKIQKLYSAPDPDGGPVTLMTIHNAKGLQFNTVILPGLGRATGKDDRDLISWEEGTEGGLVVGVAPPVKEGAEKGVAHFLEKLEKEREANERRRLLYVAVTRAMERLVMIGHAKYNQKKEAFAPVRGSLMETLWPALGKRFSEPPGELRSEGGAVRVAPPLLALPPSWTPPIVENPPLEARTGEVEGEKEEEKVFDWAREVRKHIGTVAHALLERFGVEGLEAWSAERVDQRLGAIKARLAALGVPAERLEEAAGEVALAAKTVLADENARALFAPGAGAASEHAVTSVVDGHPRTRRIDRTYIDAQGVRWIVDFKLSAHEGGGLEEFLKLEEGRHRKQLADYAAIMKLLEPGRFIRAALYYPLLGRLVEVEVDSGAPTS